MPFLFVLIMSLILLTTACITEKPDPAEGACVDAGGCVTKQMMCIAIDDFPNVCEGVSHSCSFAESREVKICNCGKGKCFNGTTCIVVPDSFTACAEAGYPVLESSPEQCRAPNGHMFTEGEEICTAFSGERMTLFEAKNIAMAGACGSYLKEPYLKNAYCSNVTGTWLFNVNLSRPFCSPVCMVDIVNKSAELNWRCSGFVPP